MRQWRGVQLCALLHGKTEVVQSSYTTSSEEEKGGKTGAPNFDVRGIQALLWSWEEPGSNLLLLLCA